MQLASTIEHTCLKPSAGPADIERLCKEAIEHGFFGVCVNGAWIQRAHEMLTSSNVVLVSVAGFPLGAMAPLALAFETEVALRHGAREIDMVLPVGLLKDGDLKSCEATIASVVRAAGPAPVKVILETALLTTSEKTAACQISEAAGARFVKTCTGFGGGEATVADVKLMRNSVGPQVGVKASGGVKSFEKAMALLNAGASRLGTSSGVQIVQGLSASGAY